MCRAGERDCSAARERRGLQWIDPPYLGGPQEAHTHPSCKSVMYAAPPPHRIKTSSVFIITRTSLLSLLLIFFFSFAQWTLKQYKPLKMVYYAFFFFFFFFYRHTHTHTYSTYRTCRHVYRLKVATSFVQRERKKHNFVERYSRERSLTSLRERFSCWPELNGRGRGGSDLSRNTQNRQTGVRSRAHATDLCSLCSIHSWLIIKTNTPCMTVTL